MSPSIPLEAAFQFLVQYFCSLMCLGDRRLDNAGGVIVPGPPGAAAVQFRVCAAPGGHPPQFSWPTLF